MTNADQVTKDQSIAGRWDPLVRGAALGAAVVLVVFLLIVGILYFTSDYEYAKSIPAPADDASTAGLVAEVART